MIHTDMTFWLLLGAVIGTIARLLLFVLAVAALIIGVFLGAKLEKDLSAPKNISGRLRIDTSDETPYLFLEIDGSLNNIVNSKTISLDVVLGDYLPHK